MRKYFILLMIIPLLLLSACTFPVNKSNTGNTETTTQKESVSKSDMAQMVNEADSETLGQEEKPQPTQAQLKESEEKPEAVEKKAVKAASSDMLHITLYYQDKDRYVIPVTRDIVKQEGIAKAALNGLVDNALSREALQYYGLYPVLPAGTEIRGVSIKDGIATVDFTAQLLNYSDEVDERNIVAAVVYTLTEFKTITGVRILVDGKGIDSLNFDTDISGVLNRDNIMINSPEANVAEGSGKLDIYFFKSSGDNIIYLLPVSIENDKLSSDKMPGRVAKLLCEASDDTNLYSEIPEGSKLLNSSVKNGTVTLDFSSEFVNYGGTTREDGILQQLAYSMKQVKGIKLIRLLVEGKEAELPEGSDISGGVALPDVINDVFDR